jgi:hypothetical protein
MAVSTSLLIPGNLGGVNLRPKIGASFSVSVLQYETSPKNKALCDRLADACNGTLERFRAKHALELDPGACFA